MFLKKLQIDEIEATAATQVRVRLDPALIDEYADDMKNGAIFPPIVCFAEDRSERYVLADGFHRLAAAEKAKLTEIQVDLRDGDLGAALDHALGANSRNGARRSNADKRHAVMMALKDPRHKKKTSREIGDLCHVGKSMVNDIRQEQNKTKKLAESAKNPEAKPPKEPAEENNRPVRPEPTQVDVDRDELMELCIRYRSFPFTGYDSIERCGLTADHIETLTFAADWLDGAIAALTAKEPFDG